MKITILLLLLFTKSIFAFDSRLPERLRPAGIPWTAEQAKEVLFSARIGEIIGPRESAPLFGSSVFGISRPLDEKQFQEMISALGQDAVISYQEYVQQWLVEAVAPKYFKEVLNLRAKNNSISKKLINRIFVNLQSLIFTTPLEIEDKDLLKRIRKFIQLKQKIKLENPRSLLSDFATNDLGLMASVFEIDYSPILNLSINDTVSDEDFYQIWSDFTEARIVEFLKIARRLKVLEDEIQYEMNKDPLFLYSYYPGEQEIIYEQLISGEFNILKKGNYVADVLKINLRKSQIELFDQFINGKTKFDQIHEIQKFLSEHQITNIWLEIEKYGEHTFENKYGLDQKVTGEAWSPIRLLKAEMFKFPGKYQGEIFLVMETRSSGEYIYSMNSDVAKKAIREDLAQRKRKILYKRVVERLAEKYPLVIDMKGCYLHKTFCYGEGFVPQMIESLVQVHVEDDLNNYLGDINSNLFESSIY